MTSNTNITLFHSPQSRSSSALALLEALGAPYQLQLINIKAGEQRQPAYLAINPLGKVPALQHGEAIITEQVAIFLHLADLFPASGLAPAIHSPLRGPYLRWMVYYAACFEPALIDRFMQREPAPPKDSPYSDFDSMFSTLVQQLDRAPYLLGNTLSAADILWGMALHWTRMFKLIPDTPTIANYTARITSLPCIVKVMSMDEKWAAEHAIAAKGA